MRVRPHHTAFLENPENERRGAGKGDQFFTLEASNEEKVATRGGVEKWEYIASAYENCEYCRAVLLYRSSISRIQVPICGPASWYMEFEPLLKEKPPTSLRLSICTQVKAFCT